VQPVNHTASADDTSSALHRQRHHHRPWRGTLFAVALACAATLGGGGCSENDHLPTPLPGSDLVAPPADAATDGPLDGSTDAEEQEADAALNGDGSQPGDGAQTAADGQPSDALQSAEDGATSDAGSDTTIEGSVDGSAGAEAAADAALDGDGSQPGDDAQAAADEQPSDASQSAEDSAASDAAGADGGDL
jgi:hypothetical protein